VKLFALIALVCIAVRLAIEFVPSVRRWFEGEDDAAEVALFCLWWLDLASVALLAFGVLISSSCDAATAGQRIPVRADGFAKLLEREAVGRFGLDAPVALLAAQLHQESHWRTDAQSPYAQGLAQFTPATAAWIPGVCADLGPPNVWDARWSIRAQACFMRHLHRQLADTATPCDRWAMALSAYNGGLGWLNRDRKWASAKGADSARWFDHVELHSKRAAWAFRENRDYPRRILLSLEPLYIAAGWPGAAVCAQ
jgi:soluble lytic murein transglycosylase-like protein